MMVELIAPPAASTDEARVELPDIVLRKHRLDRSAIASALGNV